MSSVAELRSRMFPCMSHTWEWCVDLVKIFLDWLSFRLRSRCSSLESILRMGSTVPINPRVSTWAFTVRCVCVCVLPLRCPNCSGVILNVGRLWLSLKPTPECISLKSLYITETLVTRISDGGMYMKIILVLSLMTALFCRYVFETVPGFQCFHFQQS